jgi:hypothetical protein
MNNILLACSKVQSSTIIGTWEDWRHVLTCGSIDASLHRAASWGKLQKSMERWHLPQDFWTTIGKGVNNYTEHPHKRTLHSKENEPQKLFGVTFNTSMNLLQQAFRTQSHIDWDNFLKGRIYRDWLTYVRHNEENSNGHGVSKDWSAKFIGVLWEHLKRLWQFRNVIYHQDNDYKLQYTNSKLWRETWRNYGHDTHNCSPNSGTSKNSTFPGDNASQTYGTKARNVGQRLPNYT